MMRRGELFCAHSFEYACAQNDIDHHLTKPNHPWSEGIRKQSGGLCSRGTVRSNG